MSGRAALSIVPSLPALAAPLAPPSLMSPPRAPEPKRASGPVPGLPYLRLQYDSFAPGLRGTRITLTVEGGLVDSRRRAVYRLLVDLVYAGAEVIRLDLGADTVIDSGLVALVRDVRRLMLAGEARLDVVASNTNASFLLAVTGQSGPGSPPPPRPRLRSVAVLDHD